MTMIATTDPYSGLQLVELSHTWGHGAPSYPGQDDVKMHRGVKHSQHGVLAWRVYTVLHTGTHMNSPLHMIQKGADFSELSPDKYFGNGVILSIPKKNWEIITAKDLEAATPEVKENDIVIIVTGWHRKYADGLEYYGEAPGLSKDAAEWLVSKKVKTVGIDTPFIDCPLATSMGPHRGGPAMPRLVKAYTAATGLDPKKEHGEWNIAHKTLLAAGIPTIEQVGGDVDSVLGKPCPDYERLPGIAIVPEKEETAQGKGIRATLAATPWRLEKGDACPVRLVAMFDPTGNLRINSGK